eukprot:Em0022g655a
MQDKPKSLGILDHLSGAYGPKLQGLLHQPGDTIRSRWQSRSSAARLPLSQPAIRMSAGLVWARSQHGDQEDQVQYQGRMGTSTDQKYPTPATTNGHLLLDKNIVRNNLLTRSKVRPAKYGSSIAPNQTAKAANPAVTLASYY